MFVCANDLTLVGNRTSSNVPCCMFVVIVERLSIIENVGPVLLEQTDPLERPDRARERTQREEPGHTDNENASLARGEVAVKTPHFA
ncbi:Hypothetical protein NTJ_07446 [Nesidiocoris tenuis]|uniref:Uncharacterized protein n=1 Tax=Nesidiocoris tenuis TaxID=355587 RepID=A0ABN7AUS0_9HEMI|nr:Hypothetical protein NTJ_07446 [Nesidiocoris tenuis]